MSEFWRRYLHPDLARVIEEFGYTSPTPIQELAIPVILDGAHTLIIAPTGSGKTEAAFFPILSRILESGRKDGIQVIYITPARALNRDVNIRLQAIAQRLGVSIAVRHGDTPESERRRQVRNPPTILITTPETLQVVLITKGLRKALRNVKWVIIDEIHELINDKRGIQLSIALERLVEIAGEFQRIGLSATIGNAELASSYLGGVGRHVKVVSTLIVRDMEIRVIHPEPADPDYMLSQQLNITPQAAARLRFIVEVASKHRVILIFTNTRDEAELLGHRLKRVLGEENVGVYHSSLDRDVRESLERRLREGLVKAVVSTSSLELGIDIGTIDVVIQYSSPRQVTRLIQRIGRSRHRLGKKAIGYVITRDPDDYLESLVITKKALGGELERDVEYHEGALDVLQHQVAGIIIESRINGVSTTIDDILRIVRRAHPYRGLTRERLEELLRFMESLRLIRVEGDVIKPRRGLVKYYLDNLSMIPDQRHFKARDVASGRVVGELDEEFVETIEIGAQLILAGRPWRVIGIEKSKAEVYLEPLSKPLENVPSWIGEEIPVPREVAEEVFELRDRLLNAIKSCRPEEGLRGYPIEGIPNEVIEVFKRQFESPITRFSRAINVEYRGKDFVIHAPLGSKGNQALGIYLSKFIGQRLNAVVNYVADPYRVYVSAPMPIPPDLIAEAFKQDRSFIEDLIKEGVKSTRLFRYRFIHVARRFGVIPKEAIDVGIERLITSYRNTPLEEETVREVIVDKLDLNALFALVDGIKKGIFELRIHRISEYTPLASLMFKGGGRADVLAEGLASGVIIELVKRRIEEREITLLCLRCGWHVNTKVKYVQDPACPRCGMRQIAVLKHGEDPRTAFEILKRARRGMRLTDEEKRLLNELLESANVVLQYGRLGVIALSAYGIGPTTAIRKVLSKARSEEEVYALILEAEKQYLRTRRFWE